MTMAKATVECNVATIRAVRGVGDAAGAAGVRTSIRFFNLGTPPLLHCRTALMKRRGSRLCEREASLETGAHGSGASGVFARDLEENLELVAGGQ